MKCLGVLGGMSWESTRFYYEQLNQKVKSRLGGLHSANLLIRSFDFQEVETLQVKGMWQEAGKLLAENAQALEKAGAEGLLIATNTMHKVFEPISEAITIPVLHIANPTGEFLVSQGARKVLLLGTRFTMEQTFYRSRLESDFGLEVLVPSTKDIEAVSRIIYEELCLGNVRSESQKFYVEVIEKAKAEGAEAVILGCTEICMLINEENSPLPTADTTQLHASAAVDWMLGQ